MKKLTATIFASLLTVVSVGAARADIASQEYVDQLNTAVTTNITANTNAITVLNGAGEGSVSKSIADEIAKEVTRSNDAYAAKSIETTVENNADAITTLNANDQTEGSVDYKIAQSAKDISDDVAAAKKAADDAQDGVDTLKAAVEDETKGLEATNTIATDNAADIETLKGADTVTGSVANTVKTAVDSAKTELTSSIDGKQALSTAAYQMGNADGGWTALTDAEQSALQSGATTENIAKIATNEAAIGENKENIGKVEAIAKAAIPEPSNECSDPTNKCVLTSSGKGNYAWEVIARNVKAASPEVQE